MKLDCLILGIILINSFVNLTKYHSMTVNNEQNFTELRMGEKYYFTIYNDYNDKKIMNYAFKIKIPSSELSSPTSLLLSYITHYYEEINPKRDEGNLTLSFSIDNNYNTYESSSCYARYKDKYISFVLITKYDIGSASIMITEASSGIGHFLTFLIVFSSLLAIVLFVISTIGFIKRGCTIISPQNSPQPENNASSLTDQLNQQPQPQISDLPQNEIGYIPDQLQIND